MTEVEKGHRAMVCTPFYAPSQQHGGWAGCSTVLSSTVLHRYRALALSPWACLKCCMDPGSDRINRSEAMLAAVARRYGSAEVVAIEKDVAIPTPKESEVLVEVSASSFNALDVYFLTGQPYLLRLAFGFLKPKRLVHGADVCGTVRAIGTNVKRFAVGDVVFGEVEGGGFGEFLSVHENHIVAKPQTVSVDDAAATPVAGLTALQGLRTHADLKSGEHVLINGAAGGVGTFAVQIAKAMGAEVTAVCSSRNVEMVRKIGADHVVDYNQSDFVSNAKCYDVMLDTVGNRTPQECISVLRSGGRYVMVGGPKENAWLGPLPHFARLAIAIKRSDRVLCQYTAKPNVDDLTFLGQLLQERKVIPQIERVVGLDGVIPGFKEMQTGHAKGKIVVHPSIYDEKGQS